MTTNDSNRISEVLTLHEKALLADWLREQSTSLTARQDLISEADLRQQSADFLTLITAACRFGNLTNIYATEWKPVLDFLDSISLNRVNLGFSPSETATFIFSLKQPLFSRLQQVFSDNASLLLGDIWNSNVLLDKLGLYTNESYLKTRDAIIKRQQMEMLELSTPVVKLWDGILAVPLIGTLDSARTLVVMESLLQSIVDTGSSIAIVDITGVPTVDTLVAQHLLKTAAAARLMGAQCLISGIRPQIAQTMVHLGVEFGDIVTKATLADALAYAFRHIGHTVTKQASFN
jgi:rsbT co-antagonist protein RsbR